MAAARIESGAADVDVLDDVLVVGAARDGLHERIEVADDEVDRLNAVGGHGLLVFGIVADGENAAVDERVQRLDPAVEHLGEAGHVGDLAHRQFGIKQRLARAAGRDKLDAQGGKATGQVEQTRFIADA